MDGGQPAAQAQAASLCCDLPLQTLSWRLSARQPAQRVAPGIARRNLTMTLCCDSSCHPEHETRGTKREAWRCCGRTTRTICARQRVTTTQRSARQAAAHPNPLNAQTRPSSTHCSMLAPRDDELNSRRRQLRACTRERHALLLLASSAAANSALSVRASSGLLLRAGSA